MNTSITIKKANAVHGHGTIAGLALAAGLLAAPMAGRSDTVYVSDYGNNTIKKYDSGTRAYLGAITSSSLNWPTGLAFDKAGNLYVGNWGDGTISKITPAGATSVFFNTGSYPNSLAFDSAGNLYAAIWRGWIEKITPDGVGSVFASLDAATGLAFDSAGNLYASSANNIIEKYTPSGASSVFANSGLSEPWGLAFDSAGNLYAANNSNNTIERFTPGGSGSVFASSGLFSPEGLAFDSAGNLYAANFYGYGKDVERFTPAGAGSVFANTGANAYSGYLAVQAVPEPPGWAMVNVGLAALVGLRRHRSRAAQG